MQQAQFAHASADLGVIIYPAVGLNQGGASMSNYDAPGVCVSVDRGKTFHQVPFPAADIVHSDWGPRAINCTDDDHCWAYKAYQFGDDNRYLFYTTNASSGLSMTWTRGALPDIDLSGVTFRQAFFAPDNQHGWLVGDFDSKAPLLFATSDGGATWEDLSAKVQSAMGDGELWTGAAADADHIWTAAKTATSSPAPPAATSTRSLPRSAGEGRGGGRSPSQPAPNVPQPRTHLQPSRPLHPHSPHECRSFESGFCPAQRARSHASRATSPARDCLARTSSKALSCDVSPVSCSSVHPCSPAPAPAPAATTPIASASPIISST